MSNECMTKLIIEFIFESVKDCKIKVKGQYFAWDLQKEIIIKELNNLINYIEKQNGFQGFLNMKNYKECDSK